MPSTPDTDFQRSQHCTRRLLDDPTQTVTMTHAQLADAVQRVMMCKAPAIVQGIWNVLAHEAAQREQARISALTAQTRTLRQQQLEAAFGSAA